MDFRSVFANELAQLIGEDATINLCEAYPGLTLYIPATPSKAIIAAIGETAAILLCQHHSGVSISLPRLTAARAINRHNAVKADRANGLSASQLARKYNYCLRSIWLILSANSNEQCPNLTFNF